MVVGKYIRSLYSLLFMGMLLMHAGKSEASFQSISSSTALISSAVVGAGCLIALGVNWWRKVDGVEKNVVELKEDIQAVDKHVREVQKTQAEHTTRLETLQESSDKNFQGVDQDLADVKETLNDLKNGQEKISENVNAMRGSVEVRLDAQAKQLKECMREIVVLKGMVAQLLPAPRLSSSAPNSPNGKQSVFKSPYERKSTQEKFSDAR